MIDKIILFNYLDSLFPDARCSLNYKKDYELLIAIMLSAQTTDKAVNKVTAILFSRYDSLEKLKSAEISDIESIISFLGMYHLKAKNIKQIAIDLSDKYNNHVPCDEKSLLSLPGIGNKTKNCFLAEWYHLPFLAVDTHVTRISKRLGIVKDNDDVIKIENKLMRCIPKERLIKTNHQLIDFGRLICKAKNPQCDKCELSKSCPYYLPKK